MRALTFALGLILVAYSLAGVASETFWQDNVQINRDFCQFLLCNNPPLVWHGRDQLRGEKEEGIQQAIITFRTVLQRDPQDPYRWIDLGDAFFDAGQKKDAQYSFDQVVALAPHSAPFLLSAADFYFQEGENQKGLPITARILSLIPDYDPIIFNDYVRTGGSVEDVLHFGLPKNRRAAKSWLQFLIQAKRPNDATRSWDWVTGHGYADDTLAGEYVEFLIRQGNPESAASAWAQYEGVRGSDYGKSTYLFNGDFESDPAPSPFDWNLAHAEGVGVARDCTTKFSEKCSLRIRFAGTQNLGFAAASQLVFVRPGLYRFHAFIRTEALTTDQGIRFRISDAEMPARLDEIFGQFVGTSAWSSVDHEFVVSPNTKLLRIETIRQPSLKFDNKVAGTAWIDDLKLELITANPQL